MKIRDLRLICFVAPVVFGLLVAWNACFAQEDADLIVGQCQGCGYTTCSDQNHNCTAEEGKKCSRSEACCVGPDIGTGTCDNMPGLQCQFTGCVARNNESCGL